MDKHKISISFKTDRMHIYDYLKHTDGIKDNISAYICDLIEKDMSKRTNADLDEYIKALVGRYVQEYFSAQPHQNASSQTTKSVSPEDIDLINSLF